MKKSGQKDNFEMVIDLLGEVDDKTAAKWVREYQWWKDPDDNHVQTLCAHGSPRLLDIALDPANKSLYASGGRSVRMAWADIVADLLDDGRIALVEKIAEGLINSKGSAPRWDSVDHEIGSAILRLGQDHYARFLSHFTGAPTPVSILFDKLLDKPKKSVPTLGIHLLCCATTREQVEKVLDQFPALHSSAALSICIKDDSHIATETIIDRVNGGKPLLDDPFGKARYSLRGHSNHDDYYEEDEFLENYEPSYSPAYAQPPDNQLGTAAIIAVAQISCLKAAEKETQQRVQRVIGWETNDAWQAPSMQSRIEALSCQAAFWSKATLEKVRAARPVPSPFEVAKLAINAPDAIYRTRLSDFTGANPSIDEILLAAKLIVELESDRAGKMSGETMDRISHLAAGAKGAVQENRSPCQAPPAPRQSALDCLAAPGNLAEDQAYCCRFQTRPAPLIKDAGMTCALARSALQD